MDWYRFYYTKMSSSLHPRMTDEPMFPYWIPCKLSNWSSVAPEIIDSEQSRQGTEEVLFLAPL